MATKYGAVSIKNEEEDKDRAIELPDDTPAKCRDPLFAILFVAHLAGMVAVGIKYGSFEPPESVTDAVEGPGTDISDEEAEELAEMAKGIVYRLALPSAVIAFVLAFIATAFVIPHNTVLAVKVSVVSWLVVSVGILIATAFMVPSVWTFVVTVPLVALSVFYIWKVWRLIPFAAVNLKVALKGMSANWGIYIIATAFSFLTFFWVIGWYWVANGFWDNQEKYFKDEGCGEDQDGDAEGLDCETDMSEIKGYYGFLFLFLVSLYWTTTVILNTVRVTVAGVMATWCFDAEDATSCCSPAVTSSLIRATFLSFGSICFGSLLEAIITALRIIAEQVKEREDADGNQCDAGSILACILTCILRLIENVIEYFNQWAYIYVGIYGTTYLESGRRVMELFQNRGWTALFTTDLASHVLMFTSVFVGILTGLIGMAIDNNNIGVEGDWDSFVVGLVVGLFICHVMMNVILGAVNTVIVCFADAPEKLDENHPELTREMVDTWVQVFPECGAAELVGGGAKFPAVV